MTAITITDLANAKSDVDHIAAIATSPALLATDRLGHSKNTLAGQMAAVDTVLNAKLVDAQSQITIAKNAAADSASAALATKTAIDNKYRGALAADPDKRTDGSANVVGDEVFNTAAGLLKRWNGVSWQASDINTANLAQSTGAGLVGFDWAVVPTGANTAGWGVRTAADGVNFLRFVPVSEWAAIAAGTSTYDCLASVYAAIASVSANASYYYTGGPSIYFPPGKYTFSGAIQLKATVTLRGNSPGQAGGYATKLVFPADSAGIVVNRYNTLGDAPQADGKGADGSAIEGLWLQGGGGSPNLLRSGIRLRGRATVRNCLVSGFAGAGLCISADTSVATSSPYYGNANNWRVDTLRVEGNKYGGMYVSGGDANAGVATMVDATGNGRYGIFDGAFLGNTYVACHSDSNGMLNSVNGLAETSVVTYAGNRYYLVTGQQALAATTTPGTNEAVWASMGAGGVHPNIPTWTGADSYVEGGAYSLTGSANFCSFLGCYTEGGQAPPQIGAAGIVVGGFMGPGLPTGAAHLSGVAGGIRSQRPMLQTYKSLDASYATNILGSAMTGATPVIWAWGSSTATPFNPDARISWKQENATGDTLLDFYGIAQPVRFNGYSTVRTYGRSGPSSNRHTTEISRLVIGTDYQGDGGRRHQTAVAAPASGEWAQGDITYNSSAVAGGFVGWVCTVGGTPGTWKTFGAISA